MMNDTIRGEGLKIKTYFIIANSCGNFAGYSVLYLREEQRYQKKLFYMSFMMSRGKVLGMIISGVLSLI